MRSGYGRHMDDDVGVTVRPDPPMIAPERETLRGWLNFHRATLAWKCDGLADTELKRRSMPPSTLTLLGLVRHMAEVERHWFRRIIASETIRHVWSEDWNFQAAYDASNSTRAEAFGFVAVRNRSCTTNRARCGVPRRDISGRGLELRRDATNGFSSSHPRLRTAQRSWQTSSEKPSTEQLAPSERGATLLRDSSRNPDKR